MNRYRLRYLWSFLHPRLRKTWYWRLTQAAGVFFLAVDVVAGRAWWYYLVDLFLVWPEMAIPFLTPVAAVFLAWQGRSRMKFPKGIADPQSLWMGYEAEEWRKTRR